ncbi:MAG: coenzyme F420-0:L-glutamate ligase [Acidimicrobiales bacterium]
MIPEDPPSADLLPATPSEAEHLAATPPSAEHRVATPSEAEHRAAPASGAFPPVAGGVFVLPVHGIGEVNRADDVAGMIAGAVTLCNGDVVVVTQKIVSKAEGRMVLIDPDQPGAKEELVASESVRVLRRRGDLVISETRQGFVCANAGVDLSNVPQGTAALLPVDPDRSARRLRDRLISLTGAQVAVIISDTFGRPWRRGVVDVAIGCDGVAAVLDLRGSLDANGRELVATELCIADEIASAAELVMGKDRGVPVAVVRGTDPAWARRSSVASEIIRPPSEDLFR